MYVTDVPEHVSIARRALGALGRPCPPGSEPVYAANGVQLLTCRRKVGSSAGTMEGMREYIQNRFPLPTVSKLANGNYINVDPFPPRLSAGARTCACTVQANCKCGGCGCSAKRRVLRRMSCARPASLGGLGATVQLTPTSYALPVSSWFDTPLSAGSSITPGLLLGGAAALVGGALLLKYVRGGSGEGAAVPRRRSRPTTLPFTHAAGLAVGAAALTYALTKGGL